MQIEEKLVQIANQHSAYDAKPYDRWFDVPLELKVEALVHFLDGKFKV